MNAVTTRSTATFDSLPNWENRCGNTSRMLEKMMKARS
jgi:hypothetical protein